MAKSKIDKDDIKRLVENTSNPSSTTSVYSAKYVDDNFLKEITKAMVESVLTGAITSHSHTDNDTKNTAGATDTSSKIYLVGSTAQSANPQTYTHDTAYVGTDGNLYSGNSKTITTSDLETNEVSTPSLSVVWSIKNNNNTVVTLPGMTGPSITLEFGYKPTATQVQGSWPTSPSPGIDLPTRIGGLWVSSSPVTPTTPIINSIVLTNDSVSTFSISSDFLTLYALKKGITVSGTKLILPTGDVSKSTCLTVNYQIPIYYGQVASQTPTDSDILGLFDAVNGMKSCNNNSRKQVINANASFTNYWVYAYPDAWGVLTSISTLDGDMSSAFIQKTVTITRASGLPILYRLYITVKKGAFNSKNVTFN